MLNSSAEEKKSIKNSKTLITSFIPRQLSINLKKSTTKIMNSTKAVSLSSNQRLLLLHSISQFLQLNGFSKSLKNFRKEANIERDAEGGGSCSLDIEEMCFEYLKSRDGAKETAPQGDKVTDPKGVTSQTKPGKVKENGGDERKKSEPTADNETLDGANVKSKTKKKSKSAKEASEQFTEETKSKHAENSEEIPLTVPSEPAKKSKNKKKKHKDNQEHPNEDLQEKQSDVTANDVEKKGKKEKKIKKEKNGSNKAEDNATDLNGPSSGTVDAKDEKKESKKRKKPSSEENGPSSGTVDAKDEKKESKKRKKPSSEENGVGYVEEATLDNSKRRKTDNLDQSNGTVQPPKTPNGSDNGVMEKKGNVKSQKQDKSKELNGSAEPNKAFQRVKPEEVEFADERLQNNSYWAKDGADSGYGAKAQEVLGQVRGRDFRHEKTKKKRGSYRGGQIDLQTHSVKFNYDDEDE